MTAKHDASGEDALLSRPVAVGDIPASGLELRIEASEAERDGIARRFGTGAIARLAGSFQLAGTSERVHVTGTVEAMLTQTCVVTLEPFENAVHEAVDLVFMTPETLERWREMRAKLEDMAQEVEDEPDEIEGGMIDLGAVTLEFFALGLDPYPRKPGASFDYREEGSAAASPFAALKALKERGGE